MASSASTVSFSRSRCSAAALVRPTAHGGEHLAVRGTRRRRGGGPARWWATWGSCPWATRWASSLVNAFVIDAFGRRRRGGARGGRQATWARGDGPTRPRSWWRLLATRPTSRLPARCSRGPRSRETNASCRRASARQGGRLPTTVLCCGAVGPFYERRGRVRRAQGDAWTPLVLVGAATFVDVALDLVLVGPAGLGVPGAAVATVAAQGLSALLALALVRRLRGRSRAQAWRRARGQPGAHVRAVLSVGLPLRRADGGGELSYAGHGHARPLRRGRCRRGGRGRDQHHRGAALLGHRANHPHHGGRGAPGAGELARARDVARLGGTSISASTLGIRCSQLSRASIVNLRFDGGRAFGIVLYLRITCSVNGLFTTRPCTASTRSRSGAGSPRLVRQLAHRRVHRAFGLAFLLPARSASAMQASSSRKPADPALIGGAYLRHWTRSLARSERGK